MLRKDQEHKRQTVSHCSSLDYEVMFYKNDRKKYYINKNASNYNQNYSENVFIVHSYNLRKVYKINVVK